MTRKILIADTPEADRRLSAILSGHDLVMISVHFDESRMFDFLRHLQASGKHASVPVVCTRSYRFVSPAISIEGLEIAAKALGCKVFLDLTKHPDNAQGNAAVRQLVDELLKP